MSTILGLNFGHDGAACIVKDGKLEFAISTERITRHKKQSGFTDQVIDYLLNAMQISINGIDYIAASDFKQELIGNNYAIDELEVKGKSIKTFIIPHQLSHCASAYYTSSFDQSYCYSMDCSLGGPEANSLVAYGENNKLIAEYCPGEMVGIVYGDVTERLGLGPALHKSGTTMGLASYGKPFDFDYKTYSNEIKVKMNIAATVQKIFESRVLSNIGEIGNKTTNLCLSGGSLLNCNANSRVVRESKFNRYHLFPACGDDGTAVGSALYTSHHIHDEPRYSYNSQDLCYTGNNYNSTTPDYKYIANEIAKGKIIGWFQGRSEFGPRALGNRSILADPRNIHNRELINHVIKSREWFRPFAPAVLAEYYQEWFDFPIESPYMLFTALVKQPSLIPAVTHVDGTARFQTVEKDSNLHYYELIKAFGELTGVPVLLNTSLNGNGQPIIETEEEAAYFYENSNLDMMIINGRIVND